MFEPTRLAATHLADAYTQVVPLRPRPAHLPATTPPWMVLQDRAVPSTSGLVATALAVALYARVSLGPAGAGPDHRQPVGGTPRAHRARGWALPRA